MTDFVLNARLDMEKLPNEDFRETISRRGVLIESMFNYANFLKQPLELWMFVPCDEKGNVLNRPNGGMREQDDRIHNNYHQAKERCLFEGFEFIGEDYKSIFARVRWDLNREMLVAYFDKMNIEDLIQYNLQLTQTAIKQIGL